jgi:impB/mucB/samB family
MPLAALRVVAHVDLDAFYCAVERERDTCLRGLPLVVVQYNPRGDVQELSADSDRRLLEPAADNGCALSLL